MTKRFKELIFSAKKKKTERKWIYHLRKPKAIAIEFRLPKQIKEGLGLW